MAKRKWTPFPDPSDAWNYAGEALAEHWDRLHLGDREPFPDAGWIEEICDAYPEARSSIPELQGDYAAVAERLQQAWRHYHGGKFREAHDLGLKSGLPGYPVANKAAIIYAYHLEEDDDYALTLFDEAARRAAEAREAMPEHANSHYFHASALGRYSQGISIVEALAQGLGGKIRDSLERALELEPDHAEAHIAMGLYHAEIIDKVGSLVGGLTYGAKRDAGLEHLETALDLTPESPIAFLEYGNGLLLMFGDKREAEAIQAFEDAAAMEPMEAMEALDADAAAAELE